MILASARKEFSQHGYHATGVSDIIREAKIARGTFYLYFESKRAVFDELLDSLFEHLRGRIRRVDPAAGAEGIAAQMMGNVERVVDVLLRNRDITRILLREAVGLDSGFDAKLEEFYRRLTELIEGSLRTGRDMGIVRDVDVRVAALTVLGAVRQVVDDSLAAPDPSAEAGALARKLLDIVVHGLVRPGMMAAPSRTVSGETGPSE